MSKIELQQSLAVFLTSPDFEEIRDNSITKVEVQGLHDEMNRLADDYDVMVHSEKKNRKIYRQKVLDQKSDISFLKHKWAQSDKSQWKDSSDQTNTVPTSENSVLTEWMEGNTVLTRELNSERLKRGQCEIEIASLQRKLNDSVKVNESNIKRIEENYIIWEANAEEAERRNKAKEILSDQMGKVVQELLQGTVYVLEKKGTGIEVSEELLRKSESPDLVPLLRSLHLQIGLTEEDREVDVGIQEWIVMGPNWTRDQWRRDRDAEEAAQAMVDVEIEIITQTMGEEETEGADDFVDESVDEGKHAPPDPLDPREPDPKPREPKLNPKEILAMLHKLQESEIARAADSALIRAHLVDLETRHLDLEAREADSAIVRAQLIDLEARHGDLQARTSEEQQQQNNTDQGSPPAYEEECSEESEGVSDGPLLWGPLTERDMVKRGMPPSERSERTVCHNPVLPVAMALGEGGTKSNTEEEVNQSSGSGAGGSGDGEGGRKKKKKKKKKQNGS